MQANFFDGAIIGEREEQQDEKSNLILADGYRLYLLADGMGGQKAGRLASHTVCAAFRDYLQHHPLEGDLTELLHAAVTAANSALTEILRKQPELDQMGTTLIAVLMNEADNRFTFASIGDSPLYCLRQGQLQRLNANHAYYTELQHQVAAGLISQQQADEHPDRYAITSALTGKSIDDVDLKSDQLNADELLLMASDGIHTLSDGEIAKRLKADDNELETIVAHLLQAVTAKADPYQDNTTVILIRPAKRTTPNTLPLDVPAKKADSGDSGRVNAFLAGSFLTLLLLVAVGGTWQWLQQQPEEANDEESLQLETPIMQPTQPPKPEVSDLQQQRPNQIPAEPETPTVQPDQLPELDVSKQQTPTQPSEPEADKQQTPNQSETPDVQPAQPPESKAGDSEQSMPESATQPSEPELDRSITT